MVFCFTPLLRWLATGWLPLALLLVLAAPAAAQTFDAGTAHSVSLHADGTLWAWGLNDKGQVGDGTTIQRSTPVLVPTPAGVSAGSAWASLSAGGSYTMALRTDGTLWAWGNNGAGQLGDGTNASRSSPVEVLTPAGASAGSSWASVSAGDQHTLAVRTDGTLWAWGNNAYYGQLGDGTTTFRNSPVAVITPAGVSAGSAWASVSAGYYSSLALRTDGTLWAWGNNDGGQLGDGTTTYKTSPAAVPTPAGVSPGSAWASLSSGFYYTLGLRTDGTLWAWGTNGRGTFGNGTTVGANRPVLVPPPAGASAGSAWASVTASFYHSAGVRTDGTLWTWGTNDNSQLGNGTTTSSSSPVAVLTPAGSGWAGVCTGQYHTVAVRTDGTLWAWGTNDNGQVGSAQLATSPQTTPRPVGTATSWASVDAGANHSLALRTDGTLWAWGQNTNGQLGDATTTQRDSPVAVFTPATASAGSSWASVSVGATHSLALRTDGTLWAWGQNTNGQLGDATTVGKLSPVAAVTPATASAGSTWASVSAGTSHTLALRTDGTLWAWGVNTNGRLGDGTITQRTSPVAVFTPITVSAGSSWASVSAGATHSLALRTDGTLWAWGLNTNGQLGDGTITQRTRPVAVLTPATASAGSAWASVSAGNSYTLALRTDGTLWAWGFNTYGQLGDATTTQRTSPVAVPTPAGASAGSSWASVNTGDAHTLARRTDGTLWAWGNNANGRLGDGTTGNASSPVAVGSSTSWASMSAGTLHTLALRTDGTLWAWGNNSFGQLAMVTQSATPLYIPNGGALPVGLTRFTARAAGSQAARLAWATASEQHNAGFWVERALGATAEFAPLAFVPGAGSTSAPQAYAYHDASAPAGTALAYYRLRQVDEDGTASYSPVQAVAFAKDKLTATLLTSPQPLRGAEALTLHLTLPAPLPEALLTACDAQGRPVLRRAFSAPAGASTLLLPELAALPAGLYLLRLPLPDGTSTQVKVVKE